MSIDIADVAFYRRLNSYLGGLVKYLAGVGDVHDVFPNAADVGDVREKNYVRALQFQLPLISSTFFGGYVYSQDGSTSGQIDAIITAGDSPRFNLYSQKDDGKSFAPIGSCLGIACLKSTLDKKMLIDSLENIASLPNIHPGEREVVVGATLPDEFSFPFRIVFALTGTEIDTTLKNVEDFYRENPTIPDSKKPNCIHVLGKGFLLLKSARIGNVFDLETQNEVDNGRYGSPLNYTDEMALLWVISQLQNNCSFSKLMHVGYFPILNNYVRFRGKADLIDRIPDLSVKEKDRMIVERLAKD